MRERVRDLMRRHDLVTDHAEGPHREERPQLICPQSCTKSQVAEVRNRLGVRRRFPERRVHSEWGGADVNGMPAVEQCAQWCDTEKHDE